jgi:hypothetical protein
VGCGAAELVAPPKPGDVEACAEFAGAGAEESDDEDDEAAGEEDDDAEGPDAADEATPAGVVALPDPYPVDVLRGANWLPTSSMTPSTPPVSSVIVDVSSFTSACTLHDRAEVQLRR